MRIASADDHPVPNYSLLFLQLGVVRQWKPSGEVADLITLAGTTDRIDRVQLFDVSSGGALVVLLRKNSIGQSEIVAYDRAAGAIRWTKTLPIENVTALELSPENLWIAYAESGTETKPGEVGVILVETPDQTTTLAECAFSCADLAWLPGTQTLIWSDEGGIWVGDPAIGPGQTPELFLEPPVVVLNPGGNDVTGVYMLGAFSPTGRYMLLSKVAGVEGIPLVFDTQTGRVMEVPGPFLYTPPGLNVVWAGDDTLAVARAGLATDARPSIELWVTAPEAEALLVLGNTFFVGNSPAQAPFALARLVDGRVRFALLNFSTPRYSPGNGLYFLDQIEDDLLQLTDLPFLSVTQALWTFDGSGVLLLTSRKAYYVPTSGAPIYEIDAFLGVGACCYAWIP